MTKVSRSCLFVFTICASTGTLCAQLKQSSADSPTVIRSTTRLVQVDVVVTDSSGHPVKGPLTEKDFTILEDGKLQKISFFSFQHFEGQEKQKQLPPQLPPHLTTTRPEHRRAPGPPIVLLMDGVNTPPENQIFVRQQMLKFLADHFDPRMRVAVFLLGNELTMLQAFTSNPALLTAAMQKYRSQASAAGRQGGTNVHRQPTTFVGTIPLTEQAQHA